MKIGIFSDPHYCTKERIGTSDRYPLRSLDKMKTIVERVKSENIELLVCLGDFVNMEGSEEQDKINIKTAADLLRQCGVRCVCCMGNHDGEVVTRDTFETLSGFELAPCVIEYENGKQLVFLDANYTSEYLPYERHKVNWKDANVPPAQIEWLKETLKKGESIVFIHQNVDKTLDGHHHVKNLDELVEIFKENGVKTVYQGHYHYGGDTVTDGIHYITLKATCVFDEDYFLVTEV